MIHIKRSVTAKSSKHRPVHPYKLEDDYHDEFSAQISSHKNDSQTVLPHGVSLHGISSYSSEQTIFRSVHTRMAFRLYAFVYVQ